MPSEIARLTQRTPETYAELKKAVKGTLLEGLRRLEQERVMTFWRTGQLIHRHILLRGTRGDYGKRVVERLASELGVHQRNLRYMVQFARTYNNVNARSLLSWTHYRLLLSVEDEGERKRLTQDTYRLRLSSAGLADEIRTRRRVRKTEKPSNLSMPSTPSRPPVRTLLSAPVRRPLYHYRLRAGASGALRIDLGFATYIDAGPFELVRAVEGQMVAVEKDDNGIYSVKKIKTARDYLYHYGAYVERVVDGDTVWVEIDLGFGIVRREKLRLRAIDTPELKTRPGDLAKVFLEKELKKGSPIRIRSEKSDKFDRYLADVWNENGIYINNLLLETGHAVRA